MQKVNVSQNIVLYFKGVTVNTGDYSQRIHSLHLRDKWHKQFSTPQKEKPIRKKKRKEKARNSIGRSSKKSHKTNTKFHFREVTITSEHYKIFLYKKLQSTKSFSTSQKKKITISKVVLHISKKKNLQSAKLFFTLANSQKEKEKEKEKKNEKRKEEEKDKRGDREKRGEEGIMEKAGLKSFPSEVYSPLRIRSPVQFHQWAGLGNNTIPTGRKVRKNTTHTNSRAEKPSVGPWLQN